MLRGDAMFVGERGDAPEGAAVDGARRQAIASYYDYTTPFYRVFWQGPMGAIHYGLRDRWTRNPHDELLNTNRFLARVAGVARGVSVLDAGCGVGGSAVWLAANFGARVVGLTLSARQVRKAVERAQRYGVAEQVTVLQRDYERSQLPDASFDVVWAIESVCYALEKRRVVAEAFRLLKPGGRLVVADGFLRRRPRPGHEAGAYGAFVRGLVLPELEPIQRFVRTLGEVGFTAIRRWDKTDAATPSAQRMYRRCLAGYPLARAGQALRLTPALLTDNIRAGIAQLGLVTGGIITYSVVYGEKPPDAADAGLRAENTQ